MSKSPWFTIATLIVPLLLVSAVPVAANDADHKGWYLAVEAASTTPGNVDTALLASAPPYFATTGSVDLESNVTYTDFDSDLSGSITFGYSWGSSGRLQVTYWSYSDDEDNSGFAAYYPNFNFFTVGPVGSFYYGVYYDVGFDINQELEASTIDIEYKRPVVMESENLTVMWGIGLRYAEFEDELEGMYVLDPTSSAYRFPVSREIESDGIGLTGSVGVAYNFPNEIVGISSNLRVGFLVSDVDANHSFQDLDGYYATTGLKVTESSSMDDGVATTMDFEANIVFHAGERLDFDLGWFFSTWTGMADVALSRRDLIWEGCDCDSLASPTIQGEDRDRISFSGPKVRARFRF